MEAQESNKKKFTIECEMEKRWIPYFISMLKLMEFNGKIGHSDIIGFYSDGDGDFRPTFNISDYNEEKVQPYHTYINNEIDIFDAG